MRWSTLLLVYFMMLLLGHTKTFILSCCFKECLETTRSTKTLSTSIALASNTTACRLCLATLSMSRDKSVSSVPTLTAAFLETGFLATKFSQDRWTIVASDFLLFTHTTSAMSRSFADATRCIMSFCNYSRHQTSCSNSDLKFCIWTAEFLDQRLQPV